jgi:hypothetical protein
MMPRPWEDESIAPNGRRVSENFADWFGQSKVVNENGTPRIVYHGTIVRPDTHEVKSMGDITFFDRLFTTKFRKPSLDTLGSWFSTNPGDRGAQMYAGNCAGSTIYPVYLSIQNPHETTFLLLERRARLLVNGIDDGRPLETAEVDAFRHWLKQIGKDGIKLVHDEHNERGSTELKYQDALIALESEQIKSAIGNSGLYLAKSKSISDQESAYEINLTNQAKILRHARHAANATRRRSKSLEVQP